MLTVHSRKLSNLSLVTLQQSLDTVLWVPVIIANELCPVHLLDVFLASGVYQAPKGSYEHEENIFGALGIITADWFCVSDNPTR